MLLIQLTSGITLTNLSNCLHQVCLAVVLLLEGLEHLVRTVDT